MGPTIKELKMLDAWTRAAVFPDAPTLVLTNVAKFVKIIAVVFALPPAREVVINELTDEEEFALAEEPPHNVAT